MGKANNFDGLRLLAALAVLFSHQFTFTLLWEPMIYPRITLGTGGVYVFFAISGYLITGSWLSDPDTYRYLARRILRLVPGVLVACAFTYIVAVAFGLYRGGKFWPDSYHPYFNGPLWTIPYEIACYLIIAIICTVAGVRAKYAVAATFVAWLCWFFYMGGQSFVQSSPGYVYWALSQFGAFFLFAAVLRLFPSLLAERSVYVIGLGVLAWIGSQKYLAAVFILPWLVVKVGTYSWPGLRSAGRFGDLSYGVYIYAWPVQQVVVHTLGGTWATQLLVVVPAVLLLAHLSWRFVESPALRLKPARRGNPVSYSGKLPQAG
jgi:peptidoglycan/LPS O-acetylase OafA/YrhL